MKRRTKLYVGTALWTVDGVLIYPVFGRFIEAYVMLSLMFIGFLLMTTYFFRLEEGNK